jgi:wyosine [tRNA(Phe)-imidazoG37] synthetase (radical SAM superfamily)
MTILFGPVPSRRLGLSLGVDLIPPKTCTFDCLYCQVGRTTVKTTEPKAFVPIQDVLDALRLRLDKVRPDFVTFSGSGEPTLHSEIDQAIAFVKERGAVKTAVLTNGSLFWRPEVRARVLQADTVMPTLSTVFEKTFKNMHRPHPDLHLPDIVTGLKRLRSEYSGQMWVEVVLLAGLNDTDEEIEALRAEMEQIAPDRIQLNTVVRPPSDSRALPLDRERMEEIKNVFGAKAEIIAHAGALRQERAHGPLSVAILEMARRRPVTAFDIARSLNRSMEDVESAVKGLVIKGHLRPQEHMGETYYSQKG